MRVFLVRVIFDTIFLLSWVVNNVGYILSNILSFLRALLNTMKEALQVPAEQLPGDILPWLRAPCQCFGCNSYAHTATVQEQSTCLKPS